NSASGVAVDGTGNVFVADDNHRIQKFTNTGDFLLTFGWGVRDGLGAFETCTNSCQAGLAGSGDGQFTLLMGVAADQNGNVFVLDRGSGYSRIQKFDNAGHFLTSWRAVPPAALGGVAVDRTGDVFVAGSPSIGSPSIQRYTGIGTLLMNWGCLDGPDDVAVDANENVFVIEENYQIDKFGCQ